MKPLLLIDFDTTLFKTTDFWNDFAVIFAEASGQPANKYVNHYTDLAVGEGRRMSIDYDALLVDAHVAAEPIRLAAKEQLVQKSYIFEDALTLLAQLSQIKQNYDVAILTFGQVAFQNLKIEHAPELTGIPIHITEQLKNEYISQYFSDRPGGALVDDKPGQELPDGWLEIHIDRNTSQYASPVWETQTIVTITSLNDVLGCI